MPERMSINFLRGAIGTPQLSFLYNVILPFDDTFKISPRVRLIDCPFDRIEQESEVVGNSKWYFAKTADIGNINITIMEGEDGLTEKWGRTWMQRVINSDGSFNPPSFYKQSIIVQLTRTDGYVIKQFTYQGYYPLGMQNLSLSYEQSEVLAYEFEFNGDSVKIEDIDAPQQAVPENRRFFKDNFGKFPGIV